MTSQANSPLPEPPRVARWLLNLFVVSETSEAINGDLLEEFATLAVDHGLESAGQWYWRQTLKTILFTTGQSFRIAPFTMGAAVIVGFWLIGFCTRLSVSAMNGYLDSHAVYQSNPATYIYWLTFPLRLGRVFICAAVGAVVALFARRVAMSAILITALVQMALFLSAFVFVLAAGRPWQDWFREMAFWNTASAAAIIFGGTLVTIRRHWAA
jgi:hypothetical protein